MTSEGSRQEEIPLFKTQSRTHSRALPECLIKTQMSEGVLVGPGEELKWLGPGGNALGPCFSEASWERMT